MPERTFGRPSATSLQTAEEFRLHAKRQAAAILEATARQERARARLMNLAVVRQAVLLAVGIAVTAVGLIGAIGQPDLPSFGLWR